MSKFSNAYLPQSPQCLSTPTPICIGFIAHFCPSFNCLRTSQPIFSSAKLPQRPLILMGNYPLDQGALYAYCSSVPIASVLIFCNAYLPQIEGILFVSKVLVPIWVGSPFVQNIHKPNFSVCFICSGPHLSRIHQLPWCLFVRSPFVAVPLANNQKPQRSALSKVRITSYKLRGQKWSRNNGEQTGFKKTNAAHLL